MAAVSTNMAICQKSLVFFFAADSFDCFRMRNQAILHNHLGV